MNYCVLGCSGGQAPGFCLFSFLLDDRLLIDTGCVPTAFEISQRARIDHALLIRSHLDHVGRISARRSWQNHGSVCWKRAHFTVSEGSPPPMPIREGGITGSPPGGPGEACATLRL